MLRVLKPRVVAPPAFSVSKTYKEREERGGEGRRKRKKGVRIRIRVRRLERLVGLLQVDVYKKQVIVVRMFDVSYQGS